MNQLIISQGLIRKWHSDFLKHIYTIADITEGLKRLVVGRLISRSHFSDQESDVKVVERGGFHLGLNDHRSLSGCTFEGSH